MLQHPQTAQAMALKAYQMIEEKYNWVGIAVQTKAVYQQVIAERATTTW
jgi:hypothetical protein